MCKRNGFLKFQSLLAKPMMWHNIEDETWHHQKADTYCDQSWPFINKIKRHGPENDRLVAPQMDGLVAVARGLASRHGIPFLKFYKSPLCLQIFGTFIFTIFPNLSISNFQKFYHVSEALQHQRARRNWAFSIEVCRFFAKQLVSWVILIVL